MSLQGFVLSKAVKATGLQPRVLVVESIRPSVFVPLMTFVE